MSLSDEERIRDADPTSSSGEQAGYPGADDDAGPLVEPGTGGYAGRDPKTDMPRVPSAPESQDDPASHDAAPDDPRPRQASD